LHFGSILSDGSYSLPQKFRWVVLLIKAMIGRRHIIVNGKNINLKRLIEAILVKTRADNPTVLDVGANVGLFTKAFASASKSPKLILAIEPSNYVFSILNIVNRNRNCVHCKKLALSDKAGIVELKTPIKKSGSLRIGLSHIGEDSNTAIYVENVKVDLLDTVLDIEKIKTVDVVKVDVEGAEYQVIQGAPGLLQKLRPIWFVELSQDRASNLNGSAQDIFDAFIAADYSAFIVNKDYGWDIIKAISDAYDYLFVPN